MLRRFQPVLASAALITATATGAMAQTNVSPVTVSGSTDQQAFAFVQAYSAATPKIDQIPRWNDPVCAQVIGLPAEQAAQVKARVDEVAKAVGIPLGPAGCSANVQIAFTAQPQKLVDTFAKGKEWVLGFHSIDSKTRIVTQPVQAWYATATVTNGAASNVGWMFAFTGVPSQAGGNPTQLGGKVMDRPEVSAPTGCGDSAFTSCLRSVFANVFVVVDLSKAQGKNVGVLSDYVAMLALSQPRSTGSCQALPSIADLFVSGCAGSAPDGLTPTDAAYLTALYQANPEARKVNEQADIAGRMAKMLGASGGVAR